MSCKFNVLSPFSLPGRPSVARDSVKRDMRGYISSPGYPSKTPLASSLVSPGTGIFAASAIFIGG